MSGNFNRVLLIGNLTADPELRTVPSTGSRLCEFRMAINRRWTAKDGTPQTEACFVDVTVWNQTAEHCKNYLKKGSSIHVEGYLKYDSWTTESGEKRSKLKVIADSVQFLDRPAGGGGGGYRQDDSADEYGAPPPRQTAAAAPRQNAPQRDYGGGHQTSAPPPPNRGGGGGGGSYGRGGNYSSAQSAHDVEEDIPF